MAYAKKFQVVVEVPKGLKAGETFTIEVETPVLEHSQRGSLAGIALADMTDEQLKAEIINANSVLYKAKQRGGDTATIEKNEARVLAAKEEKAKRTPVPVAVTPVVEGSVDPNLAAEM